MVNKKIINIYIDTKLFNVLLFYYINKIFKYIKSYFIYNI